MATIDKLEVKGIRSYGSDKNTRIEFFQPLTIIVGNNGSGKSTILEAIVKVISGQEPPIGTNASFIRDPNIDSQTTTEARISLNFTTAQGRLYTVSRKFCIENDPNSSKSSFNTKSAVLTKCSIGPSNIRTRQDVRTFKSTKELSDVVLDHMQTRKSVLNKVLFVHQEDSLWPLEKKQTLKDNFDGLFETTQYNTIIACFREQNKKLDQDLKDVQRKLPIHQERVEILNKQRSEVEDKKKKVKEEDDKIESCESRLKSLKSDVDDARVAKDKDILKKDKEEQRSGIWKSLGDKRKNIEIFLEDTTIADLTKGITSEKATQEDEERRYRKADSEITKLGQSIASTNKIQIENARKLGMMKEQAEIQEKRLKYLKAKKEKFDIERTFSNPLVDEGEPIPEPRSFDDLDGWTSSLKSLKRAFEANVQKVTEESNKASDDINAALRKVEMELSGLKLKKKFKTEELEKKQAERTTIGKEQAELIAAQDDLWSLVISHSSVPVQEKVTAVERGLQGENVDTRINSLKDEIDRDQGSISQLERDLYSARSDQTHLSEDLMNQMKLQESCETAKSKKDDMDSQFEKFGKHLVSCIDLLQSRDEEDIDLSALRDELIRVSEDRNADLREKQTKFEGASKKVLAKRDKLINAARRAVANSEINVNSLSFQCSEFKNNVDGAKRELSSTDKKLQQLKDNLLASDIILKEASASAQSDDQIPRVTVENITELFNGVSISSDGGWEQSQDVYIDKVSNCVEKFNEAITCVDNDISKLESGKTLAESDLHEFDKHPEHMCPACGMISSNTDDMRRNLEARAKRYDGRILATAKKNKKAFSVAASVVQGLQDHCNKASDSIKTLRSAECRLQEKKEDMKKANRAYEENCEALGSLQRDIGDGSIDSVIGQVEQKRFELNRSIADYDKAARDARQIQANLRSGNFGMVSLTEIAEKVANMEENKQELQAKVCRNGQKKEELTWYKKYKELEEKEVKCAQSIDDAKTAIEDFEVQISKLEKDYARKKIEIDNLRKKNMDRIKEATSVKDNRVGLFGRLNDVVRSAKDYEMSNTREEFESLEKSEEIMKEDLKEMQRQRDEYEMDKQAAKDSQEKAKDTIINLEKNFAYRQEEQNAKKHDDEIENLKKEIEEKIGVGNDPVENLETKVRKLDEERANLYEARGRRDECVKDYRNKESELDRTRSETIIEEYETLQRREKLLQQAVRELPKIPLAIERAIEDFHTLKMQMINQTIRELWQRIYQGNDIDDIEVVYELQESDSGSSSRRNFNYRVVMRKGATKLDMLGRCSSGQKVLACLVIRLALVETFCRECRILALDEPTTNLDRHNIESIAHAMRTIIEEDEFKKRFQLILITHDEAFIEMIRPRDYVSQYYKVERDENRKSCVTARPLMEIEA